MHFHGGGYSDIKRTRGSWISSFEAFTKPQIWCVGYPEFISGVAYGPNIFEFNKLFGVCAFIFRPQTPFTSEWYNNMITILDRKLDMIWKYPSTFPQDCAEVSKGKYPIQWNELLGRIIHKITLNYKGHYTRQLPWCIFANYR